MMNPPEVAHPKQKKFCVTFEVTEGKTTGHVISFDHISSSIVSSLSSGALADHSSLSESSESLPHLPAHSSTSTNSSGLYVSRTAKRTTKPCQCCTVLNYLKLHCLCGQGNLLFVRDISSKDGVEPKEGARQPEVYSDMDLTDPAIPERTSSSTDAATPADTQESQPFPKIRLSLRPECLVTNVSEPQEDEFEAIPGWWNVPKWEQLMAFPEELPIEARPLSVPSHYKEDKKSRFLTLLWISRTLYAHDNGNPPPKGITRVFHDPRMEPELPREIYNLLDKFSDNDIVQILKRFDEVKHLARKFAGGECREHVPGDEEAHSTTGADIPPSCAPNIPSKTDEAAHVQEPTTGDAVSDSKITLVYAKFQKWYYPGIMECTVEEWDTSTRPITVQFYDGSPDQHLQPDMIFPLQRLPPGANIQLQLESNIYEDVFFMSLREACTNQASRQRTCHHLLRGLSSDEHHLPFDRPQSEGRRADPIGPQKCFLPLEEQDQLHRAHYWFHPRVRL
uniref:Kit ligand n=1 Tax=Lygus hesperus TaxID=30085 RepID=A0A0A9YRP3_LYGHE